MRREWIFLFPLCPAHLYFDALRYHVCRPLRRTVTCVSSWLNCRPGTALMSVWFCRAVLFVVFFTPPFSPALLSIGWHYSFFAHPLSYWATYRRAERTAFVCRKCRFCLFQALASQFSPNSKRHMYHTCVAPAAVFQSHDHRCCCCVLDCLCVYSSTITTSLTPDYFEYYYYWSYIALLVLYVANVCSQCM